MWGMIATWEMAKAGVKKGSDRLKKGDHIFDALETCVIDVENNPEFTSVGYGGLPNINGVVELDASFMDGNSLSFGAVASIRDFENPCSIARSLLPHRFNNFLVGIGAEEYAHKMGFHRKTMLTSDSKKKWEEHKEKVEMKQLRPYIGHDTVCVVGVDQNQHMATCTSTSGLFYKEPGRVGDAPMPGNGFYVDSEIGGACATGLGEDIMKGSTCFQIVQYMKMGMRPQEACEKVTLELNNLLIKKRGTSGDISVVAMNKDGLYGAATNIESFPFVIARESEGVKMLEASYIAGKFNIKEL